jgi:hypothetical protein
MAQTRHRADLLMRADQFDCLAARVEDQERAAKAVLG